MRTLAILLRKEMLATFGSPIAYTVAAVFLLVLGYTFSLTLFATKVANLLYIFHQMYVLTILLVPALTMRAIADERPRSNFCSRPRSAKSGSCSPSSCRCLPWCWRCMPAP